MMKKKMKGVAASVEIAPAPACSVYDDTRVRLRHQSLKQDYEELLKVLPSCLIWSDLFSFSQNFYVDLLCLIFFFSRFSWFGGFYVWLLDVNLKKKRIVALVLLFWFVKWWDQVKANLKNGLFISFCACMCILLAVFYVFVKFPCIILFVVFFVFVKLHVICFICWEEPRE